MCSVSQPADYVKKPSSLFNNYRFAVTGKVWSTVRNYYPELIPRLVTRGAIFARMSPDQKQQLVEELQGLGYYVGKFSFLFLFLFNFFCFYFNFVLFLF